MSTVPTSHVRHALHDHLDAYWVGYDKSMIRVADHAVTAAAPDFRVACIHPRSDDEPWAYVSLGGYALSPDPTCGLEFLVLGRTADEQLAQVLALASALHSQSPLKHGSVIDLQEPWTEGSTLQHLLVTLPYPYGPDLERCQAGTYSVRILWLLPITAGEFALLKQDGLEALEGRFEEAGIDFLDPARASVA